VFTGLVAEIGRVEAVDRTGDGSRLRIGAALSGEVSPGDSVAVDGVCLTATAADGSGFEVEAMNQTLALTSLGPLEPGDEVNLELALRASDRLGGHLVQGHVDAVAEVFSASEDGFARRLRVGLPAELERYAVEQGSVALDGVSLTIAALGDGWLEVSLIPETLERTTLGSAEPGRRLNLEVDVIGKYVERSVSPFQRKEDR
jgi:riboflavin synthase